MRVSRLIYDYGNLSERLAAFNTQEIPGSPTDNYSHYQWAIHVRGQSFTGGNCFYNCPETEHVSVNIIHVRISRNVFPSKPYTVVYIAWILPEGSGKVNDYITYQVRLTSGEFT